MSAFSEGLNLCLGFSVIYKNGFITNAKLILKFLTSQPRKFTNALESKDNQAKKFGQLIECNMRNIFLEKSFIKYDGEIIPGSFSKNTKLSISLDQ